MLVALPNIASATNRITVYLSQNPDTNETNQGWRYQRLYDGTMLRDLMGIQATTGAWSNLIVVTTGSLNVKVDIATPAPSTSPQAGMLYQLGPNDPNAVPQTCPAGYGCNQLLADTTQIVIPALITANSSTISVPAPGSNSVVYLIEGQINTVAANSQSLLFISSSGAANNVNVPTEVDDTVSYQSKEGAISATPVPPSADSGWLPIATVLVPTGATSCNASCTVTMLTNYDFTGNNFGKVNFGGNFAQDGGTTPSTLTTAGNVAGCGFSAMAGFLINNVSSTTNGNHLIAGDLAGDVSVCGQNLEIFNFGASGTGPATITVDTNQDNGSVTTDVMYPAAKQDYAVTIIGTCTTSEWCTLNGTSVICDPDGPGVPNAAIITNWDDDAQSFLQTWTTTEVAGGGIDLNLYNSTGNSLSGNRHINYVCL